MDIKTLPAKEKAEVLAVRRKLSRAEVYEENERLRAENERLKGDIQDLIEAKNQVTASWLECLRRAGHIQ
jgi:regulator of replication initiation timing